MDYKFYAKDQIGEPKNLELVSGILPQELRIYDIREAYDYEQGLVIIDSNFHSDEIPKELFQSRLEKNLKTLVLLDMSFETGPTEDEYNKKIVKLAKHGVDAKNVLTVLNKSAIINWPPEFRDQFCFIDLFAISSVVRHLIVKQPVCDKDLIDRKRMINLLIGKVNKPSRIKVINAFRNHEARDSTLYSFLETIKSDNKDLNKFIKKNQGPIDGAPISPYDSSTQGWGTSTRAYDDSLISFICETHETADCVFLTEKTYRPIINKSPFVIRAPFPALAYLRSIGFKTFGDYVDESYDESCEITDGYSNQLVDCAYSLLKAVPQNYDAVQEIVDHNYKTLINFAHKELAYLNKRIFSALT